MNNEPTPSTALKVTKNAILIVLLFIFLLIVSTFIKVKLEDRETEELEMMEEFKRQS